MDVMGVRLVCAAFLVLLGAARMYYALAAKAHPINQGDSPAVNWRKHIPAYVTSTVWTAWVGGYVLAPEWMETWESVFPQSLTSSLVQSVGLGCMMAGLWLFWYSHRTIGQYWVITVQLKEEHRLITHGPYRLIRNPLYTAFFLAYVGTVLALHSWVLTLMFPLFVGAYVVFAREEERMLEQAFGEEYLAYKRHSGMFLPPVRRRPSLS